VWSWWPEGAKERVACYPSFRCIPLPPPSSGSSYILRSPSVITPSHHSLNTLSLILHKRRITSISQQHFHNQRVCCDHQFTDRCSERESPTRPRSSPLRLDPQASSTALRAGPCTQQPHSAHLIRSTAPSHIMSPLLDSLPGAKTVICDRVIRVFTTGRDVDTFLNCLLNYPR
jgi:hypothetical protein